MPYLDGEDCPDPVRGRGTRRGFCRHLPEMFNEQLNNCAVQMTMQCCH